MRRNGFELKMQERYSHYLAAESEAEMEDWVNTLKLALQSSSEDRRNGTDSSDSTLGISSLCLLCFPSYVSLNLMVTWYSHSFSLSYIFERLRCGLEFTFRFFIIYIMAKSIKTPDNHAHVWVPHGHNTVSTDIFKRKIILRIPAIIQLK